MLEKTYCVYKYVWENGDYYIGRTSSTNAIYKRFGNDKQYKDQFVYKRMCLSPYKEKICFESDNIFKVYWLEHRCIKENWLSINCLNVSTEERWLYTLLNDYKSQNLKSLGSMMIECENWIEEEGKDLVNKILNYNWENIDEPCEISDIKPLEDIMNKNEIEEEKLNSDYVARKLF